MSAPMVSVLIGVRNGRPLVGEAVASVLSQRDVALELIVVDDGSQDGTADEVTRQFGSDERLRVLKLPPVGRVASLNAGVDAARGRYLAILDADDRALPGRFRTCARFLDLHPEVGAVGGGVDKYIDDVRPPRQLPRSDRAIRWQFLLRNPMVHSAVMFRTDAVRQVGGYSPAYDQRNNDSDLLLRVGQRFLLMNLPVPLSESRVHAGQHFAAVDAGTRARTHASIRRRAAGELRFRPYARPVAHFVALGGAARSHLLIGLLGRHGRMRRGSQLIAVPAD